MRKLWEKEGLPPKFRKREFPRVQRRKKKSFNKKYNLGGELKPGPGAPFTQARQGGEGGGGKMYCAEGKREIYTIK